MKRLLIYACFVVFGVSLLSLASCAEYGDETLRHKPPVVEEPEPEPPLTCEPCEECEQCNECPECEECPNDDPCSCFDLLPEGIEAVQRCLTDMVRNHGMCTLGHHMDIKLYCKRDGRWKGVKTWVYPCDETPWYDR